MKSQMKKLKGFTIIELLVVVAIIAVLASVVLINVLGYVNKGKNSAIKVNLSTVLTNAAIYFDTDTLGNGSYASFCDNTNSLWTNPEDAIDKAGGSAICIVSPDSIALCSCSTLKVTTDDPTDSTFCLDSTGYKRVTQNANGCAERCPDSGLCVD